MKDLTFIIGQQIGIYYKTREWASKIFNDIVDQYPIELFTEEKIRKPLNFNYCCLSFKDGTSIRFIPADTSSRGKCFSKIIIEPGIDDEIINCVIRPTLKHINREIMVVEGDDAGKWWWIK